MLRGASQPWGSGGMLPGKFEVVRYQSCNFMHFGGQSFKENEWFMFIKLDVASSAVSPFKVLFSS